MKGIINFKHDTANDVIIVEPHWNIETKEDCEIWYNQWADYMSKFKKKMDVIMILDDFNVHASIGKQWGEYRVKVLSNFTRFSYRVNSNLMTGIFVKTSGVRYNASSKEASSIEGAVHAIKEDIKAAEISG